MYSTDPPGMDYRIVNFVLACVGGAIAVFIAIFVPPLRPQAAPATAPLAVPVETPKPSHITVYVTGAVRKPGVYTAASGSRLYTVLQAAGGFTARADSRGCNLARHVKDEEMIVVPEAAGANLSIPPRPPAARTVNVNLAGIEELSALPGLTAVLAQHIIEYRTTYGPFHSVDELKQVPGLSRKLKKIRSRLTVEY